MPEDKKDYLTKKIAQKSEVKFSQAQKSPLIAKVIEKLKRYKYINDEDFANWLLNSRLKSSSPRSLRVIQAELKIKGIDADLIENASKFTPNESEQAKKALSKNGFVILMECFAEAFLSILSWWKNRIIFL